MYAIVDGDVTAQMSLAAPAKYLYEKVVEMVEDSKVLPRYCHAFIGITRIIIIVKAVPINSSGFFM